MSITAIVLTAGDYTRTFDGIDVLVQRQSIGNAFELLHARFRAIQAVRTSHFFYLDDDDDLPGDVLDVLADCEATGAPLAYTDELVRLPDGSESVREAAVYDRALHLRRPMLVHHLALCELGAARLAARSLPVGHYCPELLLYWAMARQGAAYVPRVGYVWNKRPDGMHRWPLTTISQMRAALWCKDHP